MSAAPFPLRRRRWPRTDTNTITTKELRGRVEDLWIARDAAICSDYRDMNEADLWAEYRWVSELDETAMGMARGEVEPPEVQSIEVVEMTFSEKPDRQPDPVSAIYAGLCGTDRADPEAILVVLDLARAKCLELRAWNARKRNPEDA